MDVFSTDLLPFVVHIFLQLVGTSEKFWLFSALPVFKALFPILVHIAAVDLQDTTRNFLIRL